MICTSGKNVSDLYCFKYANYFHQLISWASSDGGRGMRKIPLLGKIFEIDRENPLPEKNLGN
jgi:hypothetical protein